MNFSFLPGEVRFFEYFAQATANLLEGARLLQELLEDYDDVEQRVAQITEVEHRGDFIVHEVTNLLPRTLITPIDGDDIQRLVSSVDDALDTLDAAAQNLLIYQVTEVREPARRLADIILEGAQELDAALQGLRDKKQYDRVHQHIVKIHTLENKGDRLLRSALSDLVAQRSDLFDFIRWKEIYDLLEATTDRIEDAGDVIVKVMIANA